MQDLKLKSDNGELQRQHQAANRAVHGVRPSASERVNHAQLCCELLLAERVVLKGFPHELL